MREIILRFESLLNIKLMEGINRKISREVHVDRTIQTPKSENIEL